MARSTGLITWTLAAALWWAGMPDTARAQQASPPIEADESDAAPGGVGRNLVVLGVHSIEGDDEFANEFSGRLRTAAGRIAEWNLSPTAVSVPQMMAAHGCAEFDAPCATRTAEALHATGIVFGTAERTSPDEEYDFSVTLNLFDAETSSIVNTLTRTVARAPDDPAAHDWVASDAIEELAGKQPEPPPAAPVPPAPPPPPAAVETGQLNVQVNVQVALVQLDGIDVGQTEGGRFVLQNVPAGEHRVAVIAVGHHQHETRVTIGSNTETTVSAALMPMPGYEPPDSGPPEWIGYSLIGLGAASLAGTVVTWVMLEGIDDDPTFLKYRDAVARSPLGEYPDVCELADQGLPFGLRSNEFSDVSEMCNIADVAEVLQYVLLGTAIVSGGVGIYLLATASDEEEPLLVGELRVTPHVSSRSAGLDLQLNF